MISNTSALLLNPSASSSSSTENGRSADSSLRAQAETGFVSLFGQRVSGAEHSGGSRNLPADRNSSGNRNDIMRAGNDKQSTRSAERNRASERRAEERSRAEGDEGRSRESADMRVRTPEAELPKNELNRADSADKTGKTDKNARTHNRSQTERAAHQRNAEGSSEAHNDAVEEAAAGAEAVAAQTPAENEGGEGQSAAQPGEGEGTEDAAVQAQAAAQPLIVAEQDVVEEIVDEANWAEKIAALADPAAKVAQLPVMQAVAAQAAVAVQGDAALRQGELNAPILVPGLLEEDAQGALSGTQELTLNLALEDGQGKGAQARGNPHAALLAQKGGAQTPAAALASAQQAAQSANAKAATAQTGESFAAVLAAKGVAGNGAAGTNVASTVAATGAGAGTAANSAAQAQHLNALTGSVPGQTSANGTRTVTVQQLPVYTPAGQKGWTDEMSVRLSWLAQRGEGKAELVLSPPNMGKLGVTLHMNGDQMTAQFVSASAATRDMLEQALPRLRELLQQSNIQLAQADVSTGENPQQLFQGQAGEGEGSGAGHSRRGSHDGGHAAQGEMATTIATNTASSLAALMGDGAIDIFA